MQKLLTLAETSERMRRSTKAIRQLIFRGRFPFTKIGGKLYVEETELEKFLNLSRKTSAEQASGKEAA